jgi:hypothetical protein
LYHLRRASITIAPFREDWSLETVIAITMPPPQAANPEPIDSCDTLDISFINLHTVAQWLVIPDVSSLPPLATSPSCDLGQPRVDRYHEYTAGVYWRIKGIFESHWNILILMMPRRDFSVYQTIWFAT